jgi:hypothetical protein
LRKAAGTSERLYKWRLGDPKNVQWRLRLTKYNRRRLGQVVTRRCRGHTAAIYVDAEGPGPVGTLG